MPSLAIVSAKFIITPSFKLGALFSSPEITHNFWCLQDIDSQKIIATFHGLATSRKSGEKVAIGYTKEHSIRFHHCVYDENFAKEFNLLVDNFKLRIDGKHIVYQESDCLAKWMEACNKVQVINKFDLDYPILGLIGANSNTVYRVLAEVMNINAYRFPSTNPIGIDAKLPTEVNDLIHEKNFGSFGHL